MNYFKGIKILVKKELGIEFNSSMIYIFSAIFSFVIGGIFYNGLSSISEVTNVSIVDRAIVPTFSAMNFLLMIFIPMLTMSSFVQEKRDNTLNLLKLSNLSSSQIFFSKFLTAIIKIIFILSSTIIYPIIMSFSGFDDWSMIFTNYLGLMLLGSCYLVIGILSSLLTKNYIVSIVTSFGLLFSMLILLSAGANVDNEILGELLKNLSIGQHVFYFTRGAIVSFDVMYFLSFIGFFSFVGVSILEVRR